jgi:hypothetical protein
MPEPRHHYRDHRSSKTDGGATERFALGILGPGYLRRLQHIPRPVLKMVHDLASSESGCLAIDYLAAAEPMPSAKP